MSLLQNEHDLRSHAPLVSPGLKERSSGQSDGGSATGTLMGVAAQWIPHPPNAERSPVAS